jgi:hypothetical protein
MSKLAKLAPGPAVADPRLAGLPVERLRQATGFVIYPLAPVICLAALVLVDIYSAVRSLSWPMMYDATWFNYAAWRILGGAVPYRDLFEINMPGTLLMHMGVVRFLGTSDQAFYIFNLMGVVGSAAILAVYLRPYGRWAAALGPALFVAQYWTFDQRYMGQRDFMMAPLLLLGAHVVASSLERGRGWLWFFLAGVPVGAAIMIKPFPGALLFLLVGVVLAVRWRSRGQALACALGLVAGAAAVPLLLLLWLAWLGALAPFYTIFAEYTLPVYGSLQTVGLKQELLEIIRQLQFTAPFWPLAVLLPARLLNGARPRSLILLACLLYGVAHILLQGRAWPYHFILTFFMTLLAAAVFVGVPLSGGPGRLRLAAVIALTVVALPLSYAAFDNARKISSLTTSQPLAVSLKADLLAQHLGPDDTVQVLDTNDGGVTALYQLQIRQPTGFYFDAPLFYRPELPVVQALRQQFMAQLAAHPPRLVVYFHRTWPEFLGIERLQTFPALAGFLAERYIVIQVRSGAYTIYGLKP